MDESIKQLSLTKRQREIFDFLREKIIHRGYGPTVREIGTHFEIRSPNGVMCHLKALEKKGLIIRESNMSRAIQLVETTHTGNTLRMLGTAFSGNSMQPAVSSEQRVDFGELFDSGTCECLQVEGTEFTSLGIDDGDYLIVNRELPGEPGSLVAALNDRHSLTLRRIQEEGQQPAPAISADDGDQTRQVLGPVVGLFRRFHPEPLSPKPQTATKKTNGAERSNGHSKRTEAR